jgi:hypothetical protein
MANFFDNLSRQLASAASRRQALRLLCGSVFASLAAACGASMTAPCPAGQVDCSGGLCCGQNQACCGPGCCDLTATCCNGSCVASTTGGTVTCCSDGSACSGANCCCVGLQNQVTADVVAALAANVCGAQQNGPACVAAEEKAASDWARWYSCLNCLNNPPDVTDVALILGVIEAGISTVAQKVQPCA